MTNCTAGDCEFSVAVEADEKEEEEEEEEKEEDMDDTDTTIVSAWLQVNSFRYCLCILIFRPNLPTDVETLLESVWTVCDGEGLEESFFISQN